MTTAAAAPIPDLSAHLDAAERACADATAALQAALAAVPAGDEYSAPRYHLEEAIKHTQVVGHFGRVRAAMTEIARPKGPMVEIRYPSRVGPDITGRAELAEVTSGSLIMRGGERYSRKTGKRSESGIWREPPYITAEERARVLALPRPPAAAKKATR